MTTSYKKPSPAQYTGYDKLYIDGRWETGHSSHVVHVTDPYEGSVLADIPGASEDDLNRAFESAQKAQRAWAAVSPGERAQVLRNAYDIVKARKEEICDWSIRESGSVRIKAEIEWQAVLDIMEQAMAAPYRVIGHIMPGNIPGKECRVYKKPLGVIAVIGPWDFAMHLSNRSIAPAVAVGNAVVLKPSSDTPVTGGLMLAKIYEEAGLPAGVFNVVSAPVRRLEPCSLYINSGYYEYGRGSHLDRACSRCRLKGKRTGPGVGARPWDLVCDPPYVSSGRHSSVQLSMDETKTARFHYEIGKRLAPLRDEGILIIGSGNLVHNLQCICMGAATLWIPLTGQCASNKGCMNGSLPATIGH